ncbi:glycoside hydrolase [Rhodocaloribacter litoris]|uniref:sialidase family protein n=1 Tax=Rhodocaloribacter litoris TaxID=2558931 RepID=UPI0014237998|nr:sialidase family protein [Rhodocaloribacter litoris]QXD15065.1 glycoside hydrolase [Rhodocaloribacter litoris]
MYLTRQAPDGRPLGEPVRVNHLEGDATIHAQAPAQVALGPEGHVYVAWTNHVPAGGRRFPASNLRFARSTDGGRTFEPALSVNSDAGDRPSSHTFHDLAVGPDGTVYIAWLDGRARDAMRAETATTNRSGVPAPGTHGSHDPGRHDHAVLPGIELRVAVSRDGGRSFEETAVVAADTCPCCRTALAVAEEGTVYLAWRHIFPGGERDIALARSTDGGRTFTEPVRVHADRWRIDGCPHAGPSLALDRAGRLHVAWYTGVETRAGLYYAMSADGGRTFTPPVPLATGVGVSQVKLGGHGQEHVWLAWEDRHTGQLRLARTDGRGDLVHAGAPLPSGEHPAIATGASTVALAGQTRDEAFLYLLPAM